MNDCPRDDVQDLLPDLMYGRLDAAAQAEVMRHVAACPTCTAELALLRTLRSALAPHAVPLVDTGRIAGAIADDRRSVRQQSPDAVGHIAPAAAQRGRAAGRRGGGGRRAAWRAAAAIVVVAGGIAAWSLLQGEPAVPHTRTATAITTPVAVQAGLEMDGGVSDLPDSDVEALLQSLDSVRAVPDADPSPVTYHLGSGVL
jgi:anti-sigma factor RsiW